MVTETLPEPIEGQVLIRNIYLSLDPANRGWINESRSYVDPVNIGDVMRGISVGVVEASKNPQFKVGDVVTGLIGWQEYHLCDGKGYQVLPELAEIMERAATILKDHPVNVERRAQSKGEANSIWLWGEGSGIMGRHCMV